MTSLDAYTTSQLQMVRSLIEATDNLADLKHQIDIEVMVRTASSMPIPSIESTPCPTPDCPGLLVPWPVSSRYAGCPVVGCVLCRFSRLLGGGLDG